MFNHLEINSSWHQVLSQSGIGLWEFDVHTQTFVADNCARSLFGVTQGINPFRLENIAFAASDSAADFSEYLKQTKPDNSQPLLLTISQENKIRSLKLQSSPPAPNTPIRGTVQDVTDQQQLATDCLTQIRKVDDLHELAGLGY